MPRGKKSKGMKWSALTHNQHTARSPRLQSLLHLCEASKHGFPHGVFVGICSRNTIGAALGSQASASHSHLGLEGKRHGMSFGCRAAQSMLVTLASTRSPRASYRDQHREIRLDTNPTAAGLNPAIPPQVGGQEQFPAE